MTGLRRRRDWHHGVGAAVALTGVMAVVARAAGAPLSHSTPIDARSAATPVTALYVLALAVGVLGLVALAVLMWPGRRRRGDDDAELERVEPEIHWFWKLVAIVIPFAFGGALVAAVAEGVKLTGRRTAVPGAEGPALTSVRSPGARAQPGTPGFSLPGWLPWTLLGLLLVAVLLLIAWLWRRRDLDDTEGTRAAPPLDEAVREAIGALGSHDDPRAAVIAAYGAMRTSLADHGVPPRATEAPREYLERILRASNVSERDARTLTGLFEEARFSTHPISEPIRRRALSALDAVRSSSVGSVM